MVFRRAAKVATTLLIALGALPALSQSRQTAPPADDPTETANPTPPQFLVFDIAGLPLYGSLYHSWFILRGNLLWHPTGTIDLQKFTWPRWEMNQVPPAISYNGANAAELVIYDDKDEVIERVTLKKSFVPQLYKAPPQKVPDHFKIELATSPERVRVVTKAYEWPKVKQLFSCDIEVIEQELDKASIESNADSLVGSGPADPKKSPPLETSPKVKLCLESLQGVAKNADSKKQWYVDISWPKPQSRRSAMFISETERMLKSSLVKNKHVLITRRTDGRHFIASAGLTQNERLQKPSIEAKSFPKKDWHGDVPTRAQDVMPVGDFTAADGARLIVSAFASDTIEARSLDSPDEFNPSINVQFVRASGTKAVAATSGKSPTMRETEFREEHTGITGFFRSWFIAGSANYATLKSGRGDSNTSLNAPSVEVAWKSPYLGLEPFLTLEPGYVHQGSNFALQEFHSGARYRWLPHVSPFVGYFSYGLRGSDPTGSARLGSIDGISLGVESTYRSENYLFRGWLSGITTSPFSFDSYAELSKIIDTGASDRGLFIGLFTGYTVYRQDILSLTRTTETFSETRFKVGVTLGLAGPDYLSPGGGTIGNQSTDTTPAANSTAQTQTAATTATAAIGPSAAPNENARYNLRVSPLFVATGEYRFAADYRITPQWTLGPELGYNQSTSTAGTVSTTTKGYLAGARANWYPRGAFRNGWYLAPSLDYAMLNVASNSGAIAGSGPYNTVLVQGTGGYHLFFQDFNVNVGVGYQYASQAKISLAFSDGTSKDYSYNSQGWVYEATLGWAF